MSLAVITESHLTDIADAIREKNGSTDTYTPEQMAAAVAAIPAGGLPEGVFAQYYIEDGMAIALGSTATSSVPTKVSLTFSGITSIKSDALRGVLDHAIGVGEVIFPDLTAGSSTGSSLRDAFADSGIAAARFPVMEDAPNRTFANAFQNCLSLNTLDFSKLKTAGTYAFTYAFNSCNALKNIEFPLLESVDTYGFDHAFNNCINLETITFPALKSIASRGFQSILYSCRKVTSLSFPSLESIASDAFYNNAFSGANALTELHFPAAMQSTIEALSYYSTLWGRGAGNATVYFDL